MLGERHLIVLLTALQFIHTLDFVLMMPLGPAIMADLGMSTGQFAVLVSCYTFASGAVGVVGAFRLDRAARRPVLLWSAAGFTLGTLAMGLAPGHVGMLLARVLAGACGGLMSSLVMILASEAVPYERRGQAMGTIMTSFSLASVLGIPLGVALAAWGSWHTPFIVLAGVAALVTGWVAVVLPRFDGHLGQPHQSPVAVVRMLFTDPGHRRVLILTAVLQVAGFTVIPFISPFLVGNRGFTATDLGTFYAIGGVATVITAPLIGRLADRWGKHVVFTVVSVLSLVPILLLTHLPPWPVAVCFLVTTAFMILVSGRMVPVQALITASVDPARRGAIMSFVAATQAGAIGGSSLLAGHLVSRTAEGRIEGFGTVGLVAAGATLLSLILVVRVRPLAR